MAVWSLINETLAIIVWPLALLGAAVVFRVPLRGLIDRIKDAEIFGHPVHFEPAITAEANARLAEEAVDTPQPEADQASTEGAAGADRSNAKTTDRRDVEDAARTFAQAGWKLAAAGEFAEPPIPKLQWNDDGSFRIAGWSGKAAAARGRGLSRRERIERLESQIQDLQLQLAGRSASESLAMVGLGQRDELRDQLHLLKTTLAHYDPESPWAI